MNAANQKPAIKEDKLPFEYRRFRLLGLLTTGIFVTFVFQLQLILLSDTALHIANFFLLFLIGLMWLGATALTRHAYVIAMELTGTRISLMEFLLTQFMAILFPLYHRKLKKHMEQRDVA